MIAAPYQRCSCRDPETGKELGQKCPNLKAKGHARGWYYRRSVPAPDGKRRQPEEGPFATRREAEDHQAQMRAQSARGGVVPDKSLTAGRYLDDYAAGKLDVKQSSRDAIAEAIRLYWKPAFGHLRLVGLRDHHISEAVRAMMQINRPLPADEKPSDVLLRMLAARADDERRQIPAGERRHKKSTKPLSPARIQRLYAVLHAALEAAVRTHKLAENPCAGVVLPRAEKVRPVPWSADRETRFRAALQKTVAAQSAERELTAAEKQQVWTDPKLRPAPVCVWLPAHTGRFLDYLEQTGERLAALFVLVCYCGLRRAEALGLHWTEADLDQGVLFVLQTASDGTPKTDSGVRAVPLPGPVVAALKAWRKVQASDRLAWGPDWPDDDLIFTREDGTAVPGQWASSRFETLAYRAGLPPCRFHDLRHGAASLCKAAGLDTKFISSLLGHARSSFTDDVYVLLFPEVARAAAEAAAAIVPRSGIARDI